MTTALIVLIVAIAAYAATASGRQIKADRDFRPITIPPVTAPAAAAAAAVAGLGTTPAPAGLSTSGSLVPTAAGVSAALSAGLASAALGRNPAAKVLDAGTGATLFDQRSTESIAPASTGKLLVAAAILRVHKATDRFQTRVVAGPTPTSVVLVGGGDPTLTGATRTSAPAYPQAARIADLAAQVAKLRPTVTQVLVDGSLFTGPSTAPGWGTGDAPSEYASPITAAMIDGGRDEPTAEIRSATPDLAAGQALAAALGGTATVTRGTAATGASVLGQVASAPVGRLVEQMLQNSDNVIAEVLARQVAIATRQPASFAGGAAAVASTVAGLGVTAGAGMRDASGLSTLDRVPAAALAAVLLATVSSQHPELHPILAGLPVAGWEGTLSDRFTAVTDLGRGVVRAKTGTLGDQGVTTEAGTVLDADGRLLVFVLVANGAPDTGAARAGLDAMATALARCGCR